jgi:hypothetical protein
MACRCRPVTLAVRRDSAGIALLYWLYHSHAREFAAAFAVESRQSLFSIMDIVTANPHANYDISPDGKTFVMVRRTPATRIMVIQNLPALVRRLQGP